MEPTETVDLSVLPLRDALLEWGNPRLLDEVRSAEREYSDHELNQFYAGSGGRRFRLIAPGEGRETTASDWMGADPDPLALHHAWEALLSDFRQHLADRYHVTGTQTHPTRCREPEVIPGGWLTDADLFFSQNTIQLAEARFGNVKVSLAPQPVPSVEIAAHPAQTEPNAIAGDPAELPRITPENCRALSDDEVLLLLEEHGRRVVAEGAAPLIQPSRVSFGPILLQRMHWHAQQGILAGTLAGECAQLIDWLKTKIEHHQIPTAKAAEAPLRDAYRRLKVGSTGRIE